MSDISITPTPDYGEPWHVGDVNRPLLDRHGKLMLLLRKEASRACECVNACAGMADPATDIRHLTLALELANEEAATRIKELERLGCENAAMRGERDCLNRELSDICRAADAHTADEACEVIRAMREAIREAHAALGGCLKYILKLPLSGSDSECETMDGAHHALRKLQPFHKP